ncbi:hypothetical protein YYC_04316 [Plasmodium yoelii 17X]|uniref:YIR protein n=1 Tax=Plasmodium yoelii 17X TaxID=1323249 RepID=V7PCW8_PLAYE|nr:hypothetical protein YYC_04316 [Plasmodium yoelii 17X]
MDIINNHDFKHKLYYTYEQNCGEFDTLWKFFPDDLNESGNYIFTNSLFKQYCSNGKCNNDVNKINAGCLWLFNKFYGDRNNFSNYANNKIGVVVYFMMWLGHKLNQKLNEEFPNINEFYNKNMKHANEYKNNIHGVGDYSSYNDIIDKKKELMNISNENMSKLYDLFKILCNMINNAGKNDNGETYLKYAKEFVDGYQKLINANNVEGDSYGNQTVYRDVRNKLPSLITEKKTITPASTIPKETQIVSSSETSVSISDTNVSDPDSTSNSSILDKLISIPFIFVATLILLGIAYKYSLFGFRKRSQKQHLREKLKK